MFRVLGDATRLRILRLLSVRDACVCELAALLPVTQPAVSQHLRKLRQAGLIEEYRYKLWTFYRLHPDMNPLIAEWLKLVQVDARDVEWLQTHHAANACASLETTTSLAVSSPASSRP
jgi:ArsR family transcriptional regulator